jgi:hypothetical protein
MKKYLIGASIAALLAVPALAFQQGEHGGPKGPETRAQVEAKVKERFAKVDANHDGVITQAEFDAHREAMKAEWQKKRGELRTELFAKLDTDKNGQLSPAEFSAPRPDLPEGDRGSHHGRGRHDGMGMKAGMGGDWFARLDANKDGKVTLAEAEAKALQMFDKADANHDGTVTPEERKAAWQSMRAEWMKKRG